MKLIVLAAAHSVAQEAQVINHLFEAGMDCFHLRKKMMQEKELVTLLEAINPACYARIALHQHHAIAPAFGISRLHFTVQQRQATTAGKLQELRAAGYTLSTSVHAADELVWLAPFFNYAFLGPVFNSISKPGYPGVFDNGFRLTDAQKKTGVIALGGIDAGNISLVRQMNFDGAAVLGALWNRPDSAVDVFNALNAQLALYTEPAGET